MSAALNCHITFPSISHPSSMHYLQPHVCCLLCSSVYMYWNECPTFLDCHINSIVCKNPFEIQWNPAHPPPAPASLSSKRHQCELYNTGSFGAEDGVFLNFCWVQLPYSELGWQLECCYTLHASLTPGYNPPLHALCFAVLWQKQKAVIHSRFSSEHTLKERVHTPTHAGIETIRKA